MIMIRFNHILWSPELKSLVRIAMGSSVAVSIKFWLFQNDHDQIQPYSLKSWNKISCENCYGVKRGLVHQVLTFSKWSWSDSTIFFEVLNLNLLWELLWDQAQPCPSSSDYFKMIMIRFNHILWSPEFKSLVRVAMGSSLALSIKFWLFWNDHDQIQPYSLKSWIKIPCENCYGVKCGRVHQVLTFSKWSWSDSTIFFEVLK